MMIRRGREFYAQHYEKVKKLYEGGMSIKNIAKQQGISYSCVYHWVRDLRKPEQGNIVKFINFVRSIGPVPAAEIEEKFPKHNELFLTAASRNIKIRRRMITRKLGKYSVWYYFEGQEDELRKRLREMFFKINKIRKNITERL